MIDPPVWTKEQLDADRLTAIEIFRKARMEEPLEDYLEAFEEELATNADLLETTVDLTELETHALAILSNDAMLRAFRYLAGPPISEDDLLTLTEADSLAPSQLSKQPELVKQIAQTVMLGLDRGRFPWVQEGREPTEAERQAAVLASATLIAAARLGTKRRTAEKTKQEGRVEEALLAHKWTRVKSRTVSTLAQAPKPGEFCRESKFSTRKADFLAGMWDTRVFALECKVSNSALNSVKRLNNDAAVKAESWRKDFGWKQVVPAALLSGVYDLHSLEDAQERGLALFWAHNLPAMINWLEAARLS